MPALDRRQLKGACCVGGNIIYVTAGLFDLQTQDQRSLRDQGIGILRKKKVTVVVDPQHWPKSPAMLRNSSDWV